MKASEQKAELTKHVVVDDDGFQTSAEPAFFTRFTQSRTYKCFSCKSKKASKRKQFPNAFSNFRASMLALKLFAYDAFFLIYL